MRAVTAAAIFVHGKMEAKRKALLALHSTGESGVIKNRWCHISNTMVSSQLEGKRDDGWRKIQLVGRMWQTIIYL